MKPCLEFKGLKSAKGYGIVYINGKQVRAHRLSYLIHHGPIKKDYRICHHCDNPPCIEPEHLFQGTGSDNAIDSVKKGRWGYRGRKGSKNGNARLTDIEVGEIKQLYTGKFGEIAHLARTYGVSFNSVKQVVKGVSWKNSLTAI